MMRKKQILFEDEAKSAIKTGVDLVADLLGAIMGPKGNSIGIEEKGRFFLTRKSKSIASELELKDPFINVGISLAQKLVDQVKESVRDGSKASVLIFRALIDQTLKKAAHISPLSLQRGIDKTLQEAFYFLDDAAIKISSLNEIEMAAEALSKSPPIAKVIREAFEKVSLSGHIEVVLGKSIETSVRSFEGLEVETELFSPHFLKEEPFEIENPFILLTDNTITSAQEILPVLKFAKEKDSPLLIIAKEVTGEALSTLVMNNVQNILTVVSLKVRESEKKELEILRKLSGANFISDKLGLSLDGALNSLGKAKKVILSKKKMTLLNGNEKDPFLKEGKTAVIEVGGFSEEDAREKKELFEKTLYGCKLALESGFAPGGGALLYHFSNTKAENILSSEEKVGEEILKEALKAPIKQLIQNTGLKPSLILNEQRGDKHVGFNCLEEKLEDLIKGKILDPIQVLKESISKAVSMAKGVLTTESIILEDEF